MTLDGRIIGDPDSANGALEVWQGDRILINLAVKETLSAEAAQTAVNLTTPSNPAALRITARTARNGAGTLLAFADTYNEGFEATYESLSTGLVTWALSFDTSAIDTAIAAAIAASPSQNYIIAYADFEELRTINATQFPTTFFTVTFKIWAQVGDEGIETHSGTAQAGAAGQITLQASADASNDTYNGFYILITGGTGAGQERRILDYVGATKVATIYTAGPEEVNSDWTTNPDATSTYRIRAGRDSTTVLTDSEVIARTPEPQTFSGNGSITGVNGVALVFCSGSPTLTLPAASGYSRMGYLIINTDGGTTTVNRAGADTVNGGTSYSVAGNQPALIARNTSSTWRASQPLSGLAAAVTIDDSIVPADDVTTVQGAFNEIANRLIAITGEADWFANPDSTIAAIVTALAAKLALAGGTMSGDIDMNSVAKLLNLLGLTFKGATELTIAAGVVTATQMLHTIDTEADDPTDALTEIQGLVGLLILRHADPARIVTISHGTSANNISTPNATGLEMTPYGLVCLYRQTTGDAWTVLGGTGAAVAGADSTAIHDNVSGEIAAITAKASPIAADLVVIEDSAASNAKKSVQIGNLPAFTGDSGAGGAKGYVPAPAAGDAAAGKFLKADATWAVPAGGGDVSGPASSVDRTIPTWDGVGGDTLRDGLIVISSVGQLRELKATDEPSATTTDLGAIEGNFVDITGTTQIDGLGTVAAGVQVAGRFTGILQLTHNGTSLILPGGANITTAANDRAGFVSLGSGNWLCLWYTRADGTALVGGASETSIFFPAAMMVPRATSGAAPATEETSTTKHNLDHLLFDGTSIEYAEWSIVVPSSFAGDEVYFRPYWSPATGASAADGVAWYMSSYAFDNDDSLDQQSGVYVASNDVVLAVGDLHIGPQTASTITLGSAGKLQRFICKRDPTQVADDMPEDAKLYGWLMERA